MEAQRALRPRRVDAVEQQRAEVDVQVESVSDALHEGDRTASAPIAEPLAVAVRGADALERGESSATWATRFGYPVGTKRLQSRDARAIRTMRIGWTSLRYAT